MTYGDEKVSVSKATLSRLPGYLRYLRDKSVHGMSKISSTVIAEDLKLNPVQVRKDLAVISSVSGKPRTGFSVEELISDIEKFLGFDNASEAILVGAGQLGKTLLSYGGFANYGLKIVAAFDNSPDRVDTEINGKKVFPMEKMENLVRRMKIHIGIITVPKDSAQGVCDEMVRAGIKGIWNFAPTNLKVPDSVAVKNEDMAASLALLSKQLSKILNSEK